MKPLTPNSAPGLPMPDPLQAARGATRRGVGIACACTLFAAAWGAWPPARSTVQPPVLELARPVEAATAAVPLDLSAFDAPVWIVAAAPPPPPAPVPEAQAPPPLRLQLLGIIRDRADGTYRAALYDPDADKVVVVSGGETVAGRIVTGIEPRAVILTLGPSVQTLALRPDQQGGSP